MSDRYSQEGEMASVTEGMEQREGMEVGWACTLCHFAAPSLQCRGPPGPLCSPVLTDLGSYSQRQLPRMDTSTSTPPSADS